MLSTWFQDHTFSSIAAGNQILQAGDVGMPVRKLQGALVALGYSLPSSLKTSGHLDGVFGNETYYRVCDFQKKAFPNTAPDGKVGKKTLGVMDTILAQAASTSGPIWGESAPPTIPGSPRESDLGDRLYDKRAVKQPHDMACWAACFEFWLTCAGGGRPLLKQSEFMAIYSGLVNDDPPKMGGMSMGGFQKIMDPTYKPPNRPGQTFNYRAVLRDYFTDFDASWLKANCPYMNEGIILGYTIGGGSHVNVVGYYELEDTPCVWAMEPRSGTFKLRNLDYYESASRMFIIHKAII